MPGANSLLRTSVHLDPEGFYRQSCSKERGWLFMCMFYAASRFAPASRQHFSEETQYLLQAMTTVNESIARSPDSIDDAIIATVSCLANIKVSVQFVYVKSSQPKSLKTFRISMALLLAPPST